MTTDHEILFVLNEMLLELHAIRKYLQLILQEISKKDV